MELKVKQKAEGLRQLAATELPIPSRLAFIFTSQRDDNGFYRIQIDGRFTLNGAKNLLAVVKEFTTK